MDKPQPTTPSPSDLKNIEKQLAELTIQPESNNVSNAKSNAEPKSTDKLDEADFLDECLQSNTERLNLTADEKDDLDDLDDEAVQKEYAEFMKNIASNANANDFLGQLNKLMESGLGADFDMGGDFSSILGDMGECGQFDAFTDNLLTQFIDKEVIYEPLKEARAKVEEHVAASANNRNERNLKVLQILTDIIGLMDADEQNTPAGKEKIMLLFEELQEQGGLPEEIVKDSMGGNPELAKLGGMGKNCTIF